VRRRWAIHAWEEGGEGGMEEGKKKKYKKAGYYMI
jgi:hypothetical protein